MKKTSRAGKRSPNTALISFNAPRETKAALIRIADCKHSKQPKRGRLSSLMRDIADDVINGRHADYATAAVPMSPAATERKKASN